MLKKAPRQALAAAAEQKKKVIETFDRAKSTREVKLVYTTLAESTMATRSTRRGAIKEGFASKAVASINT